MTTQDEHGIVSGGARHVWLSQHPNGRIQMERHMVPDSSLSEEEKAMVADPEAFWKEHRDESIKTRPFDPHAGGLNR